LTPILKNVLLFINFGGLIWTEDIKI
jgi:hypothetical protein